MSQHEYEQVELTNMCAIINEKTHRVVVQERLKSWKGISFPGGHVERAEPIVPSTIREIKEETGLDISNLKLVGIKDWFEEDANKRYIVFLYATSNYSGELVSKKDEGIFFWADIDELPNMKLASGFAEMIDLMLNDPACSEFSYDIDGDDWKPVFY